MIECCVMDGDHLNEQQDFCWVFWCHPFDNRPRIPKPQGFIAVIFDCCFCKLTENFLRKILIKPDQIFFYRVQFLFDVRGKLFAAEILFFRKLQFSSPRLDFFRT